MSVKDPTYIPNQTDLEAGQTEPLTGGGSASTARRAPGRALTARGTRAAPDCPWPDCAVKEGGDVPVHQGDSLFRLFSMGPASYRDAEMAKASEKRALSNIAKLWDAHEDADVIRRYIPGVGTPIPTSATPALLPAWRLAKAPTNALRKRRNCSMKKSPRCRPNKKSA